jgi:hypothetical protein
MSLLSNSVSIIDSVTNSLQLQVIITVERFIGTDEFGTKSYGAPGQLRTVLEKKQRSVKLANGEVAPSTATLTIVDIPGLIAVTPEVTLPTGELHQAGRLHPDDRLTMPDGTVQAMLNTGGFIDAESINYPVANEVYLG